MKKITIRDLEQLTAYLDGELPQGKTTRLESQLRNSPELAAALKEMQEARRLLQHTPVRRVPRNFTLTPELAGIRPPVPRLVPAFSWASVVAALVFVCTLGTSLVGRFAGGAAAPMMAAAPAYGVGGGPPAEESLATQVPAMDNAIPTATPALETYALTVPQVEAPPEETNPLPSGERSVEKSQPQINLWMVFWPSLALVLIGLAVLVRWMGIRAFRRKISKR
jgi:anti-sigma factor RsiW